LGAARIGGLGVCAAFGIARLIARRGLRRFCHMRASIAAGLRRDADDTDDTMAATAAAIRGSAPPIAA